MLGWLRRGEVIEKYTAIVSQSGSIVGWHQRVWVCGNPASLRPPAGTATYIAKYFSNMPAISSGMTNIWREVTIPRLMVAHIWAGVITPRRGVTDICAGVTSICRGVTNIRRHLPNLPAGWTTI
jgi:hypothetical protein